VEFSTSGRGAEVGKGYERVNNYKYCVHIYANGKMRPVETIPKMGRRKIKNDGEGKFNYDIFDIL
jgi:hypothetical protein